MAMRKRTKQILAGAGIFAGLVLLCGGWFIYKFNSETSRMRPVNTGPVTSDVIAVKDEFVNMYLVKNGAHYVAVDAGKDLKIVAEELQKIRVNPDMVDAVFLTHTDMDHVAALPLFKNAKLYFAREELKMLNGKKQKIPFYNNHISRDNYTLLDNGQTINTGEIRISCILTAGHTSGSMCYQINDKYLFTGDILSLHDGKLGKSVKFFDLDHEMTTQSISRIINLAGVQYLLTSHWGISDDYTNAVKGWKEQAGAP